MRTQGTQAARPVVPPEDLGSIEGTVVNANTGEILRKAMVQVRRSDGEGRGSQMSATTDGAGRFVVTDLEPGKYRITAQRNGFVEGEYGARAPGRPGVQIEVGKAQKVRDLSVKLTPHGVVAGRVRDEDGEVVAHANVQILRWSYQQGRKVLSPSGGARTNDLGEYRIFGVRPGKYVLSVTSSRNDDPAGGMNFGPRGPELATRPVRDSEETYIAVYYPNTFDPSAAATLELGAGTTLEGMDLTLRKARTVRIRGTVRLAQIGDGERGRGRMGMVQLVPRGSQIAGQQSRGGIIDVEGRFEIRGVPPGSYYLIAAGNGGGPGGPQDRLIARMPLDVGSSTIEGIVLAGSTSVPLTGSFKIEGGEASAAPASKPNLSVSLRPLEMAGGGFGGVPTIRANEDLTFSARNVAGEAYRVSVGGLPAGHYVKSIRYNEIESPDGTIQVPAAGGGNLAIVVSGKGGTIEGTVTTDQGKPGVNSMVILWSKDKPERFDLTRTATANAQGQYTFSGLAPGDYRVMAVDDVERGMETDPEFLKRNESSAEVVSIKESSRETKGLKEVRPQ